MARERKVTRTITETTATVMTVDVTTATVSNKLYNITGMYENKDEVLKALKKWGETDVTKLVTVIDYTVEDVIYGMSEDDFIKYATKMDKR